MNLRAFSTSVGAALIALYSSAVAAERVDAVLHWNEVAQRAMAAANPLVQSRSMAITQLAVFKAVTNASALAAADVRSPTVAVEAAAMAAAHRSLSQLHPEAAAALESALAAGLAGLADAEAKTKGTDIGQRAAEAVLAARMADGWDAKVAYEARTGPGFWAATPPQFAAAVGAQWGKVTPFVLKSGDQFRPGPPAGLNSPAYIAELREVLEMGGANSSSRPAEKTDIAKFWVTSAVQGWNPAARQVSVAHNRSLLENARTLALLNVAIADALIACFDTKFTYNSWRPVTAIRAGVGEIRAVPDWQPLVPTPPFPAYPSAHACGAGAAQEILERSFGPDGHAIALSSAAAPGLTFRYTRFADVADQIDDARLYGGIHTREDQKVGRELGRQVGVYVWETPLGDTDKARRSSDAL